MKQNKVVYIAAALALGLVVGFGLVRLISQESPKSTGSDEWQNQLIKYSEIYSLVKAHYPEPFNEKKICFDSIKGFLNMLDPHSYFLDPVAMRSLAEEQQGNYYGIGTRIAKYEDRLTVIDSLEGTPAYKYGIRAGDIIAEIEGKYPGNLTIDEAMKLLRGGKDTYVSIKIRREGIVALIPFKIKRAEIPLNSISYSLALPKEPGIAYISVRTFGNTTVKEFQDSMKRLVRGNKIKALILDLRGNGGGSLYAAIDLADFFLEKGKEIVSLQGRFLKQSFEAKKNDQYEKLPLAVLINRGSASASEIVAAALQDHARAKIIGSRSWGKGLVQTINQLSFNTSVALTTAKYFTPSNKCLQRDFGALDDYYFFLKNKNYDTDETIEGGVIPDIFVQSEVYPEKVFDLVSRGVFFKFSRRLLESNVPITVNFRSDQTILEMFKKFLVENKIPYDEETLKTQKTVICREIDRETLSLKFSTADGMRAFLESDPVTNEAVNELKKNIKMN